MTNVLLLYCPWSMLMNFLCENLRWNCRLVCDPFILITFILRTCLLLKPKSEPKGIAFFYLSMPLPFSGNYLFNEIYVRFPSLLPLNRSFDGCFSCFCSVFTSYFAHKFFLRSLSHSVASFASDFTLRHIHNKVYWVQCLILSSVLPFKCNEYIRLTLLLLPFVLSFVNRRNNENWTCEHRWQRTKTPRIKDCFVKIQNECLLSHSH